VNYLFILSIENDSTESFSYEDAIKEYAANPSAPEFSFKF